ncbi:FtsK/SpoIIIE domain-containing protein [Micromonospora peucetia]|uniref:FtsK/SpoIIIE domain-containing protein n=1 Tax=Micromonospora peucetia TaxID=47871 RepID=A0A1C6V2H3_9ACTN|nr:FtsK/SpoIIIE domain-containing protein [Micromonospora peucetia]WSA35266.1 FtsK/SpoIIIE domain-containing protein [Micromonospora peucetia]SCL60533.1 FtsK/SpoIIIE family protein [Micromonospora peucetia]
MAGSKARTSRAAVLHRRVAATATAAAGVLDDTRPAPADQRRQYELADRLRSAAAVLAPGWAGAPLETIAATTPAGEGLPSFVRIGTAAPLDDARFPALVPLLGTGHLSVDVDARDPRVAGLLRAVLLRLLAATPAGALLVRAVDATGTALAPFAALADAGLLPPPAVDVAGLRAVLTEAEQWVAPGTSGRRRHDRTLLLVIAALPEATGPTDLARIEALAEPGRAAGLHLVVAGWSPAGGREPLPQATTLAVRTAYALLGAPPGGSFAGPGADPPGGLNSPVFIEADPPAELVDAVCRRLAAQVEAGSRLALTDLLPSADEELWTASGVGGLTTTAGDAGGRPVSLGFTELTPHWLVSGRSGAGRSTFLTTALLGLTARYGPDELALYLADLADAESFVEFLQTERDRSWIPQVRAAAMAADREYVLSLLDELVAEVRRREEAGGRAGGQRFAELRQHRAMPRVVCVLDNLPLLFAERDRLAVDAAARLDALARTGRAYGVHLVLAGEGDLGLGSRTDRDSVLGQFPVRVALPGGGAVLEPTNDSAAGLPVGSAVVNTAGGLGGPRGAIRGHERMVRFPDPQDHPDTVEELRHRLWSARPEGATPPVVFAGYARPLLRNDPRHRTALAGQAPGPAALLGRALDVPRSTVAVSLGPAPGRNLAVLGPGPEAARLLATAARSTAAHHEPGTARFVLAAPDEECRALAGALAVELAGRHPVDTVDLAGLLAAVDDTVPAYLVVFGLDVLTPAQLPAERLRTLLREGPSAGRHLLGRWRTVPSFAALLEPEGEVDKLAAVAVVDLPGAQLTSVFGRQVQWRPRPGRAMLWDGPGEQGTVLVPFAGEGEPA